MHLPIASAALVAAFILTPAVAGNAPALAQDFSITNPEEPAPPGRRDLMRQLQAWWDAHAYYPRRASSSDEGGTVGIHLVVHTDGVIWRAEVAESSGSSALDRAAAATFRGGFVRPFPANMPAAELDISLHYVLAHRHDEPVAAAGYTPAPSRRRFTITNDPVKSPILETMLQRTCTGEVVKEGIRNHPMYGGHHRVEAVFFRKPDDGSAWVKFYDGDEPLLAPVNEVGKLVQWTGKEEHPRRNVVFQYQYTVWTDGDNHLTGNIEAYFFDHGPQGTNTGGTVDLHCASEVVPAISWNALSVKAIQAPPGDPP